MDTIKVQMPRARQDELVVEELSDETLVYDLKRHKARCLNRSAALVWQHCDGKTTVPELAALLKKELDLPGDEAVVWMALDRLGRAHLLSEPVTMPADRAQYSRREVLRTLRRAAGISLLLPVVASIFAPRAAAQGSCISLAACLAQGPPCGNLPICGSPGQCCKNVQGACGTRAC
jgi:hypothetical protein